MTTRILLTGARGQVGTDLARLAAMREDVDVVATDVDELDLADPDAVAASMRDVAPDLVINAGAYTAVDDAESNRDVAFAVNAIGPGHLATRAAKHGIPMIHFSTDYVFDGRRPDPRRPGDRPGPLNVYGASKLAGENAVLAAGCPSVILRLCWVYSSHGRNFLTTMLRLARERDAIRVVNDQFGAPTPSHLIAAWTLRIADRFRADARLAGVYHASCAGSTSWYDFARAIFEHARTSGHPLPSVQPIDTKDYPTPAARPRWSTLDCSATTRVFDIAFPEWHTCVGAVIENWNAAQSSSSDHSSESNAPS